MAVVSTSFTITGSTTWATSTWADNDANPSFKVDAQLQAWVTAINDTSKIEIIKTPGSATARGTSDLVKWLLRCRDGNTSSDFGFTFVERPAGSTSGSSYQAMYYNRIDGTANNGYGTYSSIGAYYTSSITDPMSYLTAYEATGSTPWFVFSSANNARTIRSTHFLVRLDTTNLATGSYYPTDGISKWLYINSNTTASIPQMISSHSSISQPYKGTGSSSNEIVNAVPLEDNYFFPLRSQYGDIHWMGQPTKDILVSKSTTGSWGDTVQISNNIYTCLGSTSASYGNYWVKTSTV